MDIDQHAARAPYRYIWACDYVGCADDLCIGILRKNKGQGPVNSEAILVHKIDVDTLSKHKRCVEREGVLENGMPVTFVRIFRPAEV
jgi:hypothetical protein